MGVFLKTKDHDMKGVSASAAVTGLFGITEPAIYGVNLRLKRPMIFGCIAGAVGGAVAGGFHAVSWGYNMPGVATIPAYFKAGYTSEFIGFLLSVLISFVLGAVLTWIGGFEENIAQEKPQQTKIIEKEAIVLVSPVKGKVLPVSEVKDEAFASAAMGDGVGIIPADGNVYAPCDGTVEVIFPTGHAVGISTENIELLIHIGINTVELNGKGFVSHVKQGDTIRKGDLLVSFDKELIEKEGYDSTVIFIVTDKADEQMMETVTGCEVKALDEVIRIK